MWNYKAIVITPRQTLAIIKALPFLLHSTLVLTCAATALRASEILSLRWADILWNENRIRVSKRWAKGEDGETKMEASDGYVPLHPLLADALRRWREQTPYAKEMVSCFRPCGRKASCRFMPPRSSPTICVLPPSRQA